MTTVLDPPAERRWPTPAMDLEPAPRQPAPGGAAEFCVVVTGSRRWTDGTLIREALKDLPRRSTVIVGGAVGFVEGRKTGADFLAEGAARVLGHRVIVMPAEWAVTASTPPESIRHRRDGSPYDARAGHIRNGRMLDERPDLVLAFWLGNSPGTRGCIAEARRRGIPIDLYWRPE